MTNRPDSTHDFTVEWHGSVVLFRPRTSACTEWLDENVAHDAQWFGGALAVEHRFAHDLFDALTENGFTILKH